MQQSSLTINAVQNAISTHKVHITFSLCILYYFTDGICNYILFKYGEVLSFFLNLNDFFNQLFNIQNRNKSEAVFFVVSTVFCIIFTLVRGPLPPPISTNISRKSLPKLTVNPP